MDTMTTTTTREVGYLKTGIFIEKAQPKEGLEDLQPDGLALSKCEWTLR